MVGCFFFFSCPSKKNKTHKKTMNHNGKFECPTNVADASRSTRRRMHDFTQNYDIVRLSIGLAVGMTGKDTLLCLVQDIILPAMQRLRHMTAQSALLKKTTSTANQTDPVQPPPPSPQQQHPPIRLERFGSQLVTFILVLCLIFLIVEYVLEPHTRATTESKMRQTRMLSDIHASVTTHMPTKTLSKQ